MTEGMHTRAKAVEESLSHIQDQLLSHEQLFSKLNSMYDSLHQGLTSSTATTASSLDSIKQTMTAQQQLLAELTLKLASSSAPSPARPPLLPTPPPPNLAFGTLPQPVSPTHAQPPDIPPLRTPKLEIPFFSGNDVLDWLFQIERFFEFHQTPREHKLYLASFYFTGSALKWFNWMSTTNQLSTWDCLARALTTRFGPSLFQNFEATLYKLYQTSSVTDYMQQFEELSTHTPGLSCANLLNCFISGLKPDIKRELLLHKPHSIHEAMGMAKLVEDKLNSSICSAPFRPLQPRTTPLSTSPLLPSPTPLSLPPTVPGHCSLPIRRLSVTEMAARREKGLCFNCDEKFSPGHKCRA